MSSEPDDADDGMLDRLLDGHAPRDPDEAQRRAPYDGLAALLRHGDPAAPLPGWQQRVEARVEREREAHRRRWRWWVGGLTLAAAALAAVVLWPRHETTPPAAPSVAVAIAVTTPDGSPRRGTTAVGDTLAITGPAPSDHTELRVYRQIELVLRCPGAAECGVVDGRMTAKLPMTAPGRYHVVLITSAAAIPAPGRGATLDADLLALRAANATLELPPPVIVNP